MPEDVGDEDGDSGILQGFGVLILRSVLSDVSTFAPAWKEEIDYGLPAEP